MGSQAKEHAAAAATADAVTAGTTLQAEARAEVGATVVAGWEATGSAAAATVGVVKVAAATAEPARC